MAFAAVDRRSARRLYRAQNIIWVWLGIAAQLSFFAYLARPSWGFVMTTSSSAFDLIRFSLFFVGGALVAHGVWWVRRSLEAFGHVFFATAAVLNAVATLTLPGSWWLTVATIAGLAVSSAFRAYYIVRWVTEAPGDVLAR